ncbi:MAG TPA: FtsX-like permease family protein [Terriglobales bacterium]|jgi:putative ABC transport system permease protein|nr:FtsX-like permease family protein [Terriglobales bacterium]
MSSDLTPDLVTRRAQSPRRSMFLRMLVRAAVLRRGRAAAALLAMVVGTAAATAMLNLYVDVQAKLHTEFRNYGANVVVVAKDGQSLPGDALQKIEFVLDGNGIAVPFAYVVARTANELPVVVSGTDLDEVRKLDRWWSVTAWPTGAQDALVGIRAATLVAPEGQTFDLSFQGRKVRVNAAGILRTGSAEDSRIYLSLREFESWTDVQPSTIEIAASGSPEAVAAIVSKLALALPEAEIRPVRQIMEGEARVLGKTRSTLLVCALLIIMTVALCVLSTLMGWVFDRRRDFAIMKALGASERLIGGFFVAEAAVLGAVGAVAGFGIGVAIAAWIGRVNFHAPVVPRFVILPEVLAGGIAVALMAAVVPMFLLRRVQPATILRGE